MKRASGLLGALVAHVLAITAPIDAHAAPAPSEPDARALLARPRGSISLGGTTGGRLEAAAVLPARGPGFAQFPSFRGRQTYYGTDELVGLITRAGRSVSERFAGSVLGVGNLGRREGGPISWSVSHQAGRDADLGMFARTASGKPIELRQFVAFDRDGRGQRGKLRFDVARNLALVRALVEDEAGVQYIFVSEWLKAALLAEARRAGLSAELVGRLTQVLHQPTDSNPHADHFHVRVACTIEDRLQGCRNRGPERSWIATGDAAWARHVESLAAIASSALTPKLRLQAIERLVAVGGTPAVPALLGLLSDAHDGVRRGALRAIGALQDRDSAAPLLAALRSVADPAWAAELFEAALASGGPDATAAATVAVTNPASVLHPEAATAAGPRVLEAACDLLARRGREAAVEPLLGLLDHPSRAVRTAAHDALARITNQPIRGRGIASSSARERGRVTAAWRAFWAAYRDRSWIEWMELGFAARGIHFKGAMASRAGVERLITTIGHRDRVASDNAVHVLSSLTGHEVDPSARTPRNTARHWRSWWKDNAARSRLR